MRISLFTSTEPINANVGTVANVSQLISPVIEKADSVCLQQYHLKKIKKKNSIELECKVTQHIHVHFVLVILHGNTEQPEFS